MAPLRTCPTRGWTRRSSAGVMGPVPWGLFPPSMPSTRAVRGITVEKLPYGPGLHCTIVRQVVFFGRSGDVMIAACAQETLRTGTSTSVVGTILIGPADSPRTTADTTALTTVQRTHT